MKILVTHASRHGGAAYMFHWLKDASTFARRHREELLRRPVWIFSSGPLGTDLVDEEGQDVRVAARPKEFTELSQQLRPSGSANASSGTCPQ